MKPCPAAQHAVVWLDAELANVDSPRQAREDAARALLAALEGE